MLHHRTGGIAAITLAAALTITSCGANEGAEQAPSSPSPEREAESPATPGSPRPDQPRQDSTSPPDSQADTHVELSSSPTIEEIQSRGTLLVGVSAEDPEFVTRDGAGDYSGFDVEIAQRLAEGLELEADQVSFRRLPETMLQNAVAGGNVDLLLGPEQDEMASAGPYVIVDGTPRHVTVRPGDEQFQQELRETLDAAIEDGSWQRAYQSTLAEQEVAARPR